MNNVEYVKAILDKEDALDDIEDFYNESSDIPPYEVLQDYADNIGVELPEQFREEDFEQEINSIENYNRKEFERFLDFIAIQHLNESQGVGV